MSEMSLSDLRKANITQLYLGSNETLVDLTVNMDRVIKILREKGTVVDEYDDNHSSLGAYAVTDQGASENVRSSTIECYETSNSTGRTKQFTIEIEQKRIRNSSDSLLQVDITRDNKTEKQLFIRN